jgi:thiamine biosynthesis lipoprotein
MAAKRTELIMGMPITVEIVGARSAEKLIIEVFDYFKVIDERYSTFKPTSEISRINGGVSRNKSSDEMRKILELCEKTKRETNGYFDIERNDGTLDPSGLVKGWSIQNATVMLLQAGEYDFFIDAGGDIQAHGKNPDGETWKIGIRNPFNRNENVKIITVHNKGVATSGTAIRGQHIYNPKNYGGTIEDIASITVIGPNIYEADRFATAAFAMGADGINFIEALAGFEAYMIHSNKIATMTSGFERYVA